MSRNRRTLLDVRSGKESSLWTVPSCMILRVSQHQLARIANIRSVAGSRHDRLCGTFPDTPLIVARRFRRDLARHLVTRGRSRMRGLRLRPTRIAPALRKMSGMWNYSYRPANRRKETETTSTAVHLGPCPSSHPFSV